MAASAPDPSHSLQIAMFVLTLGWAGVMFEFDRPGNGGCDGAYVAA